MSGHNKWSKIKNRKAVTDVRKAVMFTKYARLITVESRLASGDRNSPGLRSAIEKARKVSMPSDNIDRAIQKGIGGEGGSMESVVYETYGPGGAALIITALTDNKNRTAPEIKHLLSKHGCALAAPGSALWGFELKDGEYVAQTPIPLGEEDGAKLEALIEALEEHDDVQDVYTNAE